MAGIYGYHDILFKTPQSVHLWRQADCLSQTMNYFQDDNPFFEPSVHYLGRDGTGKTVSDFPLIYFSVGQLWKIFGQHEFIYRLIVMLFFFSGLFAMFKLFENVLKDSVLAIALPLFLFTSPALIYYANNFLMNIPALSLAMIGLYFFSQFYKTKKNKYFYLFLISYTVAGLLKIPSLISFIAIVGLFFLELIGIKLHPRRKIFHQPLKQILLLTSVGAIQYIWYIYAQNYNAEHNAGIFLIGFLPFWDYSTEQINATFDALIEHIKWDYFRRETQLVFLLMFVLIIAFYKQISRTMIALSLMIAAGLLLFILLFFGALKDHDYYTINLFIMVPVLLLSFSLLLKKRFITIYTSLIFRIIIVAFLIHNIDFGRRRMIDRYNEDGWHNENYIENMQAFKEISPYLRSIGIEKDDKLMSLSDNSINISLYLMNQKGWTNYGINIDSAKIKEKIELGAKYLLIYNDTLYNEAVIQPLIKNKIGKYKNIDIFAL
jgi:hypothetical protein